MPETGNAIKLAELLLKLMEMMPGFIKRIVAEPSFPGDFSHAQLRVLCVLKQKKEMRMSEMARLLIVTPGTLTAMIDRLCRQGLVERYADKADRRSIIIKLTAAGETLLQTFREKLCGRLADFFSSIPLQERQELLNHLEGTITLLEKYFVHTG
ncbi:MAG: MarR family transcriptional regulator [Bacillota bacterium]